MTVPPKIKTNPYTLVYWRADWTKTKTAKNNAKYWEWEMQHNNFVPPNIKTKQQ